MGQRVTLENQIRGLAVVFGIRLPRALSSTFIAKALQASERINGLSAAMRGLIAARDAVLSAVAAIDADMKEASQGFASMSTFDDDSRRRPSHSVGVRGRCR